MPGANDFLPAIGKDRDNRESETRFEAPSPVPRFRITPRVEDCSDKTIKRASELHLFQPNMGLDTCITPEKMSLNTIYAFAGKVLRSFSGIEV